jgi:alpha-L-rhamnosidase
MGWSGDINVFSRTATYTMASARFLAKWMQDMRDAQSADGAFPDVAPKVGFLGGGAAGWGDAGVTVPWNLYQAYGDRRVLETGYPAMQKWISYLEDNSDGLLRPASGYGDWLNVDDETPKDVIGTAYFAHASDLVAQTARTLGRAEDAKRYDDLAGRVRAAFTRAYVTDGGARVKGETQTAYVLALSMDMLPEAARKPAADRLVELIKARDWHLSTGFLGTPELLPVLTATGHTDAAYRLLHQRSFPPGATRSTGARPRCGSAGTPSSPTGPSRTRA